MDLLRQDLRYACRTLRKSPGFTAVAVLTLGLAIAAAAAIFSVVYSVLLRPLSYGDDGEDGRLVAVWEDHSAREGLRSTALTPATFRDVRDESGIFEDVSAILPWGYTLAGGDHPRMVWAARVSHGLFDALGVEAARGRTLVRDDQFPSARPVAVISHALWKGRFGADPSIVGRRMSLDQKRYTVVGVLPEGFWFPWHLREPAYRTAEIWVPLELPPAWDTRAINLLEVIGRLPEKGDGDPQASLAAFARGLAAEHPEFEPTTGLRAVSLEEQIVGEVKAPILILFGAVGLLLIIAAASLAGLLWVRATVRREELALRAAMGAPRRRILRTQLAEIAVLGAAGCALSLLLASWLTAVLRARIPPEVPRVGAIALDGPVLAFTFGVSVLVVLLAGLWPAVRAARSDPRFLLDGGAETRRSGRLRFVSRDAVIGLQVAVATVLLVGAGLMGRSLLNLHRADPGFDAGGLLTLRLPLPAERYSEPARVSAFYEELIRRIEALPGVTSAAATTRLPLEPAFGASALYIEGRPVSDERAIEVGHRVVTAGYFRTMGIPLLRGRLIGGPDDRAAGPPVVLVNETLARRHWPGGGVIGAHVRIGAPDAPPREVIGVVGDVTHERLDSPSLPEVYEPHAQAPVGGLALAARTPLEPAALVPVIREQVAALDPTLALINVETMEGRLSASVARQRFLTLILGMFSGLALVLAALGVYGVIAHLVADRRREIGIRMAVGADSRAVRRLFVARGLGLAVVGVAVGLLVAYGLARFLEGQLFGVGATDPVTFVGIPLALVVVATAASWVPARRAASLDPAAALRAE